MVKGLQVRTEVGKEVSENLEQFQNILHQLHLTSLKSYQLEAKIYNKIHLFLPDYQEREDQDLHLLLLDILALQKEEDHNQPFLDIQGLQEVKDQNLLPLNLSILEFRIKHNSAMHPTLTMELLEQNLTIQTMISLVATVLLFRNTQQAGGLPGS